jgi:TatD DNase family protein
MPPNYVDLHCHLDLYPDFMSAVQDAERAAVYTLTMTTTPKAWPRNREVTEATHYVRAALGLHPQLVYERAHEISLWDQYLPEARYVGEVGIDAGPRYYRSLDPQKEVFVHMLQGCARYGDKILSVHTVRSAICPPQKAKWFSTGSVDQHPKHSEPLTLGAISQSIPR